MANGDHHNHHHHHHHHHQHDIIVARCFVLTVSDTRNMETDEAGPLIVDILREHGHEVNDRALVVDEVPAIRSAVLNAAESRRYDAVILTGGTGVGPRDVTPEALEPLLKRRLPGFGEMFRQISFAEIGAPALLSRAFAGVVEHSLVFGLPGSPAACRTAVEKLIVPLLPHAVAMIAAKEAGERHGGKG